MKNKPYFIKDENRYSDHLGHYSLILSDMNEVIGDIYSPILKQFDSYNLVLLLQNFQFIMQLPRWVDAQHLPVSNYDAIKTWNKIVRLCDELFERTFRSVKDIISLALHDTMEHIGKHQKVEFYTQPKRDTGKPIDDEYMIKLLVFYQNLYDGQYRILIAFYRFVLDIHNGSNKKKKEFDKYLNDDVSFSLSEIKKSVEETKLMYSIDWITIGADVNIRNAIAHKNWEFKDNKVTLYTKYEWSKTFDFFEIEDLVRSINIAIHGMQAALLIAFVRNQEVIMKFIPKTKKDKETIHGVLFQLAEDSGFTLDYFNIIGDNNTECHLVDKLHGIGESGMIMNINGKITKQTIPEVAKRSLRVRAFVSKSLPMLYGYSTINIQLKNFLNEDRGSISIDLTVWLDLYDKDQPNTVDYEKGILVDKVNDIR